MNKILLFAHLKDSIGSDSIELDLAGKTVAELKGLLAEQYPVAKLASVLVAINEEFARDNDMINEGDIIALLPPVSGG